MLTNSLPDEVQEVLSDYSKTQNNINNMLRDNKLLIEEAKGLQVDVEV